MTASAETQPPPATDHGRSGEPGDKERADKERADQEKNDGRPPAEHGKPENEKGKGKGKGHDKKDG